MAAFSPQPRKPSEGGKLLLAAVCSNLLWATTEISIISRGDGTGKVWSFLVEGKRLLGSERAMLNQTPSTSVELKTWATFQLQKSISRRRKFSRSNHRGIKLTSFFTRNVISFSIFFLFSFYPGAIALPTSQPHIFSVFQSLIDLIFLKHPPRLVSYVSTWVTRKFNKWFASCSTFRRRPDIVLSGVFCFVFSCACRLILFPLHFDCFGKFVWGVACMLSQTAKWLRWKGKERGGVECRKFSSFCYYQPRKLGPWWPPHQRWFVPGVAETGSCCCPMQWGTSVSKCWICGFWSLLFYRHFDLCQAVQDENFVFISFFFFFEGW